MNNYPLGSYEYAKQMMIAAEADAFSGCHMGLQPETVEKLITEGFKVIDDNEDSYGLRKYCVHWESSEEKLFTPGPNTPPGD
jgi:hypothetical protein